MKNYFAISLILLSGTPACASPMLLGIRAHPATAAQIISIDPLAIQSLNLHAVYMLKTVGSGLLPGVALTNTPVSHAQSCTCSLDANGIDFYVTGSSTLTNWDFSAGYEVHFENDQTSSCSNCKFKARNDRGAAVDIAQNADTATNVTFNDSLFDDTIYYAPGGESPIKVNGHGNVTFNRDYHTASTRGQITMGGTGILTVSYNYFGGVGMGTGGLGWGGFHAESIHPQAGTTLVINSFIDYTETAGMVTSGVTGFFNFQTFNPGGSVTASITNSVLKGANAPSTIPNCHALDVAGGFPADHQCQNFTGGLTYTIQVANGIGLITDPGKGPVDLTISNNALERGSTGYVGITTYSGSSITTHYSGNYDLTSGTSLGSVLP